MSKKTVIEQMIGLLRTPIAQRKGINIPPDECLIWAGELEKELKSLPERFNLQSEQEWSEEDENMVRYIGNAITCRESAKYLEEKGVDMIKAHRWLESLRPQLRQQWSEEDEKTWKELIEEVKDQLDSVPSPDCRDKEDEKALKQLTRWLDWLKSLKERVVPQAAQEWNKEDKLQLQAAIKICENSGHTITSDWLKSLKDRVHPKHEWSEEDIQTLDRIISNYQYFCMELSLKEKLTDVERTVIGNVNKEDIDWLKSIKPQKHWKPSEEQMEALKTSFLYWKGATKEVPHTKRLESLYEQLKQL